MKKRFTGQVTWAPIAQNIRSLRKEHRWTQAELGQKLSRRKLSRQAIAWIESGRNTDLETIADIAATLGVTVEALSSRTVRSTRQKAAHLPDKNAARPADLMDELLGSPPESWESKLARDERFHSLGVARELITRADAIFDVDPAHCHSINASAVQVSGLIHSATSEVRFDALKDLAHANWRLGRYDEALDCLDKAEIVADSCANPPYRKAIAHFVRAIVLTLTESFDEARKHLLIARDGLQSVDPWRHLLTYHHEALIRAMTNDPLGAAHTVEDLLHKVAVFGDETELARLCTVGAYAWYRAGNVPRAKQLTERAAEIHLRLGQRAEIAIDDFRRAVLIAETHPEDAVILLTSARKQLADLKLKKEGIVLDLRLLRVKAASGASTRELHELSSQLASAAIAAGLPVTACEAIDLLRQVSGNLTIDAIDQARALVRRSVPNAFLFDPPEN